MDCSPPGSSVHGILHTRILEWGDTFSSRGLPDPGIKPGTLALQVNSLLSEPLGKQAMNSMPISKTNTNLHLKNLSTALLMLHVTLSYDHLSPALSCAPVTAWEM